MTRGKPQPTAREKAMELLSRREHFTHELRTKLLRREHDRDEVDELLASLAERGWLDDRRAARLWVEQRLRRGAWGAPRLLADLGARGVDHATAREVIESVLSEAAADGQTELVQAQRVAARVVVAPGDERAAARLARKLERRGFSSGTIAAVLRERRAAASDEIG